MHVRCPHCHNPIEIVEEQSSFRDIPCPSCGSSFSLVPNELGTDTISIRGEARMIEHFELIEKLGQGAFGTVWKAKDIKLDRIVAIKVPRKEQLSAAEAEQFLREARAAAQLKHPNVVSVYEIGKAGDCSIFIVSDFVDGLTLADWLSGQQPSIRTAVELTAKIANALHAAHEQGVVHRDLKPSNIILDRDSEPHVMDFGLAKREAGEITMTAEGQVLGTPAYMAPEQARGDAHNADRRADIYSLGVILFEMMTSERPFRGNARMLIHQVLTEDTPSPRKLNGHVPKDIETICMKCLEKRPADRFVEASDLRDELRRWMNGEPIRSRPIGRLQQALRWCQRKPAQASLAGMAIALLMTVAVSASWVALQQRERANEREQYASDLKAEQDRRALSVAHSLRTSVPQGVPYLLESLHPSADVVLPQLMSVFEDESEKTTHRMRAAMGLSQYGEIDLRVLQFLVARVTDADSAECPNIVAALATAKEQSLELVAARLRLAHEQQDWSRKARWAIVALHLGDITSAADMLEFEGRPDPIQRTVFIETFPVWHGELQALASDLKATKDDALRSGICLSVGSVTDVAAEARRSWQSVFEDWYVHQPDTGTHSASGWALRAWDMEVPAIEASKAAQPGCDWFVNDLGLTMLRISTGEFVREASNVLDEGEDNRLKRFVGITGSKPAKFEQKVRLTRGFYLSDREITLQLFEQFVNDTSYKKEKPKDWLAYSRVQNQDGAGSLEPSEISWTPEHPVRRVSWTDAVLFCNWLSHREGRSLCYEFSREIAWERDECSGQQRIDDQQPADLSSPALSKSRDYEFVGWRLIDEAEGYRLPSEAQWEYACRARTTTRFSFGDDESSLIKYGLYMMNSTPSALPLGGSKFCNAWGLFDMHGNVSEWCGDGFGTYGEKNEVEDPYALQVPLKRTVVRGGSYASKSRRCTSSSRDSESVTRFDDVLGFRVALVPSAAEPDEKKDTP